LPDEISGKQLRAFLPKNLKNFTEKRAYFLKFVLSDETLAQKSIRCQARINLSYGCL
jgi:hypothetical protein